MLSINQSINQSIDPSIYLFIYLIARITNSTHWTGLFQRWWSGTLARAQDQFNIIRMQIQIRILDPHRKKMGSFATENRSYEKDLVSKKSAAFLCFLYRCIFRNLAPGHPDCENFSFQSLYFVQNFKSYIFCLHSCSSRQTSGKIRDYLNPSTLHRS